MADKYADLRASLDTFKPGNADAMLAYRLASDPETIRALLDERDRLREAVQGLLNALPSATTHPAIRAARAALTPQETEE